MPTIIRIERGDDPRLADYAAVRDPDLARRRGLFVAEGRLVVERLIAANRFTIHSLLLSAAAWTALQTIVHSIDPSIPVYIGSVEDIARVTGFNMHRGCVALVARPGSRSVEDIIHAARTIVVLEGIANPDNVGGIFRNAAAFSADAVLLSPTCCDPLYRKAIRTSMGAALRVPFARLSDWPVSLERLRAAGFSLVALTPQMPSQPIDEFASAEDPPRLALMLGAEGAGLSEAAIEHADRRVRIPVAADVDSLNVVVAAGIALSRLARARG